MAYALSTIAKIIEADNLPIASDAQIENILLDSRKLLFPHNSLFFALDTDKRSGASFISQLYDAGLRNFVVRANTIDTSKYSDAQFLLTQNTLKALQKLVAYHRQQFSIPVIGITGSNGKTIVKEWLYQCLHEDYQIARSPKSYNSQIGVPLSVWELNNTHTTAIFEAGISKPGEMANLEPIIKPQIGIFTFLGAAHAEGFSNLEVKIEEKLKLFKHAKTLVYCADEPLLHEKILAFKANENNAVRLCSWGKDASNFLIVNTILQDKGEAIIHYRYKENNYEFSIPFSDEASIHNAITVCTTLLHLGYSPNQIRQKMTALMQVEMRLQMLQGVNNCSIINDSYSADLTSLHLALDFLAQQQQHAKRTVILSDLLETAVGPEILYKQIADVIQQKNIYRFIGIGSQLVKYQSYFQLPNRAFYNTTEELLQHLPEMHFEDETILLKGARVFEFEKITGTLVQKLHQTVLEINLAALRHNLNLYKSKLSPGVKLMVMVKASSYGSGSFEIANLLQHAGVDYLAVAYTDEGVALRRAGIRLPIMVMNVEESSFSNIKKYNLEPELFSTSIIERFKNFLVQNKTEAYPVHLKLDTGMHRLGLEAGDIPVLGNLMDNRLRIMSIFSHLAASGDDIHDDFTSQQSQQFVQLSSQIEELLGYQPIRHIANTSAISRFPNLQYGMVRLGIGLYGVDSNPKVQQQLLPVTTLKTTIAQIRKVEAGESIGYSRRGFAKDEKLIATVRIGYADGYFRAMGNGKGKMWVNGRLAPTVGNICMDMTMLDITGIDAREDDEVIVFGQQLPVDDVAQWANTIPYEVLTSVSQRVKRIYFEE